jgi:hypothetical protein
MLTNFPKPASRLITTALCILALNFVALPDRAPESQASAQAAAARSLGTVKAISGKNLTLSTDAGAELHVIVQDGARLLRVEPGEKDLKNAAPLQLEDVQPGDRILVRGKMADEGKSLLAASIIAMKKLDIAQKQTREREEWQRHGVGGLVSTVDPSTGTIMLTTTTLGATKNLAVHISQNTVLRRYSPASTKFDDAKVAPVTEIRPGDQLRARGSRSADGTELTADEVVSGSFRNIAGTISSIDSSAGTITVNDLASKKTVTIKVSSASQIRKLPPPMAQRIAARLKGDAANSPSAASGETPRPSQQPPAANDSGGTRRGAGDSLQGSGDLQQILSRMPAATLADLNKGDAVMVVATPGTADGGVTAITLLAGVEPILEASPKGQSILTPWSLSTGGEPATP